MVRPAFLLSVALVMYANVWVFAHFWQAASGFPGGAALAVAATPPRAAVAARPAAAIVARIVIVINSVSLVLNNGRRRTKRRVGCAGRRVRSPGLGGGGPGRP